MADYPPYSDDDNSRKTDLSKRPKAVALEYVPGSEKAPRITATGQGTVAEQILNLAFAHGIKVREDADLVEILSVLEVDSVIPVEAYAAVGEILSYVYKVNANAAKRQSKPEKAVIRQTDNISDSTAEGNATRGVEE